MLERTRHYSTVHKRDLTPRQTEVLRMIAAGRTNPEIAEALGITLDGAKFHVREILAKLDVDSREEAADWWRGREGLASRAGRAFRGLLPAGWLKMSLAATGVAGLVVGSVVVALALNGGRGDQPTALAALEDLPACDPTALDWSTDAVLDADLATGARFTISAGSARDCVLRGDFEVAYGGSVAGPRPLQGGSVAVAVDGQRIGQSPSPVIAGTASNVCGSNLSVLAVLSQGAGIYRLDSPTPPCLDASKPAVVAAEWVGARNAGPAVAISTQPAALCDSAEITWSVDSAPEARPGEGVHFSVFAAVPYRCELFETLVLEAWGGRLDSLGATLLISQTPPAAVRVTGGRLGPSPTKVLEGVVRNQCNVVDDTMLVIVTSVQRSYWLGAPPPACIDVEADFAFEVRATAGFSMPNRGTATPAPQGSVVCDAFLGRCSDGSVRQPTAYRVVAGDTLAAIAGKTGYTEQQLRDANPVFDFTELPEGITIRLPGTSAKQTPGPGTLRICDDRPSSCEDLRLLAPYVVQPGDTLASLSARYAIDPAGLRIVNPGIDFDSLTPGTTIQIPVR